MRKAPISSERRSEEPEITFMIQRYAYRVGDGINEGLYVLIHRVLTDMLRGPTAA